MTPTENGSLTKLRTLLARSFICNSSLQAPRKRWKMALSNQIKQHSLIDPSLSRAAAYPQLQETKKLSNSGLVYTSKTNSPPQVSDNIKTRCKPTKFWPRLLRCLKCKSRLKITTIHLGKSLHQVHLAKIWFSSLICLTKKFRVQI